MYRYKAAWITLVVIACAGTPLMTAWFPLSQTLSVPLKMYPGNQAFVHAVGVQHPYGWEAYYRVHRPGYLVKELRNGGDRLTEGTYQYDFYFALRPGHLANLLSGADDIVRVEIEDTTTREKLLDRTFQMADFKRDRKGWPIKSLTFSTWQRGNHLFEPRIYWYGLSGIFLQRVALISLEDVPPAALQQKADHFERLMRRLFLEHGYVVTRDPQGRASDTGDAAIWTGLYAAAQAWRYRDTQEQDAEKRMEQSLWALHALYQASPMPGTLVRYIDSDGKILEQAASKDTYTGFFYGVAQALPYVHDPKLKKALQADLQGLADHFLNHDFSFLSPYGNAIDFNPYPSRKFFEEAVRDLRDDAALRRRVIRAIQIARWYFWINGQSIPPSFSRFEKALKHPSTSELERELLPFVNDLRLALKKIQTNVHRSAISGTRQGLSDTPYIQLDLLLLKALGNLDWDTHGRPLSSLRDLKILPSEALHALHFLKVAGEALPKPNRFEEAYTSNLYDGKALLKTAIQWHQFDEDLITAALGETEANTRRTASAHLSFLALHDLILLEKDPILHFTYQKLFEQQYKPMRSDGNAMIDAMQASVGLSSSEEGLALWSLGRYPLDRVGKGEAYWKENRKALLERFGGEVNGQAREPIPPDLRPRDAFIWQRSAHSIRGDEEGWLYPPLDYLFAYWLARTALTEESRADP